MAAQDEEVFWELLDSKGKPGKTLKVTGRSHRYQNSRVPVGKYTLQVSTPDLRLVIAKVHVASIEGKHLLHKTLEVRNGTEVATFEVEEHDAPASLVINYSIRLPGVLGIAVKTKILRKGPAGDAHEKPANEIYREVVKRTLGVQTPFRHRALQGGLLRPYLFLASMHPSARSEIASVLGVNLEKISSGASEEAETLIYKNKKGLVARTMESWEKVADSSADQPNWFRVLNRAAMEAFKSPLNSEHNSQSALVKDACSNSSNPLLASMEAEFLERLSHLMLKKLPRDVNESLSKLLSGTDLSQDTLKAVQDIRSRLNHAGFTSEAVHKFALSFLITSSTSDNSLGTDDLVRNLQERLFTSTDPTNVNARRAQKVGKVGVTVAIKAVLFTFVPVIGVVFMATMITHHILESSHDVVMVAVINIVLQRLLLVVNDIRIEDYY